MLRAVVAATADEEVLGAKEVLAADAVAFGEADVTGAAFGPEAPTGLSAVALLVAMCVEAAVTAALVAGPPRSGTVTTIDAPAVGPATGKADTEADTELLLAAVELGRVHAVNAVASTPPTSTPRVHVLCLVDRLPKLGMPLSYTTTPSTPGKRGPSATAKVRVSNRHRTRTPTARTRSSRLTMTVQIRPALDSLPAYAPGRTVPGAIKLASNELSFPTLPAVSAAILGAIGADASGINRYPDNGAQALIAALSTHVGVDPSHIIAGCGSVALCQQLVQATCSEGDEVMFGWRSFEAYPIVTQIAGAVSRRVPVTAQHALDLPAMAAAVTPRTRLIYICTPNNPTGTVVHQQELLAFLDAVPENVLVVVDEAYGEFDTDPDSPDGVALATSRPNVLSLRTLSKAYQLAGLRVGYAVGDPAVITALAKVAIPFAVNSLAQQAAIAALGARDELKPRWQQVISERSRVTDALRAAGYEVPTSQANFVWLPLRERAAAFAAHTEANKVIVRPFSDATGGVRVTIGSPAENDAFLDAARSFAL
ncbi:histidinol-phosphate aminotransferase [Nakamurella panacisegetis]|uniref:Aromatic amino acid aminotransferase n=1 Tax=Nakamurella panacisegetis TaxID=1090615 RepID=A0A1H0K063_9ACTN|nr:histidinol-phosphate aminotransferase [Nakamurella panacisegetis]